MKAPKRTIKPCWTFSKRKTIAGPYLWGHLVIEKLLKALYSKEKKELPPLIHDLRRIAEKAEITLSDERKRTLDAITRFNINARYDDYKQSFYLLCTKEFASEWIEKINNTRTWIKTLLSN